MSIRNSLSTVDLSIRPDLSGPGRCFCHRAAPALARGAHGEVQLNLTLFRGLEPSRAGGSLLICIDIGLEQADLAQAQRTMPGTLVSPLPYLRGEVQLVAPGLPAMTAPVAVGQSCVAFAHRLQPEMASLFRKIILETPAQCGVVFDLAYFDAHPDPAWAIQANWTEVDRLLVERAANEALTPEEIRRLVDDLIQRGDARLDFDPAWGEPGAVASEGARAWLDEYIAAHFFQPSFAPEGGSTPRFVRREHGAPPDDAGSNARTVERHVYGQASLEELLASTGRSGDAFVHLLDLDDLQPAPLSVQIFCPGLGETIATVQVDLEYGAAGQRSVTLHSPGQPARVDWPFDPDTGPSYRYSYHGTYRGSGLSFEGPVATEDARFLVIAPPPALNAVDRGFGHAGPAWSRSVAPDWD